MNNDELNSSKQLDLEALKSILNQIKDFKIKVEVLGGEPLLKPWLIWEIISILKNYNVTSLKISTNGSLIDEERIKLLKNFDEVQISLDAADEKTYKKIRGEDFNKIIENIRRLIEEKINISLSFVVMKINYNQIENFFKLAKELNVNKINIGYFIPAGRGIFIKNQALSLKEIEILSKKIKELEKIYGIEVYSSLPEKIKSKNYIFPAGSRKFSISPNGHIIPCIFLRNINLGKEKIERLILVKNNYTICPAFYP